MIDKMSKLFGIVGLILAIISAIDLIFYWPTSDYEKFYLIKYITFIIAGLSVFWRLFLKGKIENKSTNIDK